VNRAPDGGEGHSFSGIYREIVPPEKLVFGSPSSPEQGATLVFTEEGTKTKLTMTIECASRKDRDAMLQMRVDAGTAQTLANLAAYLNTIAWPGATLNAHLADVSERRNKEDL
jgi:uncharacterized protein YndB with AHSA1/START domain